jgi:hypothetical protein
MESSRHEADNGERYRLYFDILTKKVKEFNVLPKDTYNMDEKGFMIGVIGRPKEYLIRYSIRRDDISKHLMMPTGSG